MRVLIISDKRAGHESQSVAFCKLKNYEYDIVGVKFSIKALKIASYILDFFKIYISIFKCEKPLVNKYDFVVSAGSSTYYANKYFSKKFMCKNIALMMPKGFKKDFTHIFATKNDTKKELLNLTTMPVNLNFLESTNFYNPQKKTISFIIGGDNKIFTINHDILNNIDKIMAKFSDYEYMITTSPRTPKWLENELKKRNFNFAVWFSENKINPIYDFVTKSEFVFITQDSISMISEAVCNGSASVGILELDSKKQSKFHKFIDTLIKDNLVFKDMPIKTKKLNLKEILDGINI